MHSATIAATSVVKLPGLVRCRLDAALSQRELAAIAEISPATVARLEGGQEARPRTIRKLAEALKVTPKAASQAAYRARRKLAAALPRAA